MTGSQFEVIGQQPLSHSIAEVISEAIVSGKLKPGAPIVQSQLASELGVSRAPLREALNKLAEEGLVEHVPYKGTIVAPLNRRDVEELRSLRLVIERFAASLLIERITDDELAELQEILQEMQLAAEHGDEDQVFVSDLKLHAKIFALSGHGLAFEIWQMYEKRFRRVLSLRNKENQNLQNLVDMHAPLMEALRQRDRAELDRFYTQHGADLTDVLVETWPDEFVENDGTEAEASSATGSRSDRGSV